ncbi:Na+/H+ antiporter subunit E [Ectothiorhodospiraceae bacterium 2226]|nr:Na+/H+ antiporter subunit E [Ectothiorhodospiraceae bacterium 2226]
MHRLLPHPLLTAVLIVVWLLLVNNIEPGHIVLAVIFGVLLPMLTHRFWPDRPHVRSPLALTRFVAVVLWDIVIANLNVARLILGPTRRLRPAFVTVPLDTRDEFTITLLASTISLTPGTVSSDVAPDRSALLVHALDVEDVDRLVRQIKTRYEAPLMESFGC